MSVCMVSDVPRITPPPPVKCSPNACGFNTECRVTNGIPICYCLPSYTGDPYKGCSPTTTTSPPLVAVPGSSSPPPFHPPTTPSSPPRPPIECEANSHCSPSRTCINQRCVDPCTASLPCAVGAECTVIRHRPVCRCPSGFQGNPQISCTPIPTTPKPDCLADRDCPLDKACAGRQCVDPCRLANPCSHLAECTVVGHMPDCTCILGYVGNGYYCELSTTTSTTPGPIAHFPTHTTVRPEVATRPQSHEVEYECTRDFECDDDEMCHNRECEPVCIVSNPCTGDNTACRGINHRPVCQCLPGFVGNPFIECKRPLPSTPSPECLSDRECPDNKACAQRECINPCILSNPCSLYAECTTRDHFPVCTCILGFTGNGYFCDRLPPIVEIQTLPTSVTRPPIAVTTITHSPIAEYPTTEHPRPKTPSPRPPFLPPLPSISVGCKSNDDCPYSNSCINKLCVDVCHQGYCGKNADCSIKFDIPMCSCPPGTSGDPFIRCKAVATEAPPTTLAPLADTHSPLQEAPLNPVPQPQESLILLLYSLPPSILCHHP
nr:neurogenic locus notch homolog protein 4-like [Penaeus vannamei]